jgi:hypothetical protein
MKFAALTSLLVFLGCAAGGPSPAAPDDASQLVPSDAEDAAVGSGEAGDAENADLGTGTDGYRESAPADRAMPEPDAPVEPFAVCPPGIAPTFASIDELVFKQTCGTGGTACHSSSGSLYSGGLDLQAGAWDALVGKPGNNIAGSRRDLLRVAPGDPDASLLVLKLRLKTGSDPELGSGMPFGRPGSVCPATLTAIAAWIAGGAAR